MIRKEWKLKRKLTVTKAAGKFLAGVALSVALSIAVWPMPQLPGTVAYVKAVEPDYIENPDAWGNGDQNPDQDPSGSISNNTPVINRTSDRVITDDDRADADADMLYYMQSLEVRYKLDEKVMENLHKVFDSAVYYIANTEMSLTELWAYVSQAKSNMESTAVAAVTMTTSEFLQVGDNWETPTVSYGQKVSIVLPVINFGTEELNDLIIQPQTSTVVSEWPFEPDMSGYLQTEPFIPGNQTKDADKIWPTAGNLRLPLRPEMM